MLPPNLQARAVTWQGCRADGNSFTYARTSEAFFQAAVEVPSRSLTAKIESIPLGRDRQSNLQRFELEQTRRQLHTALALALAGVWERDLREYLARSSFQVTKDRGLSDLAHVNNWEKACAVFASVRGFRLAEFPSFDALQLLRRIGSAARHGNGPSARGLYIGRPDLFLDHNPISGWWGYYNEGSEPKHSVKRLNLELCTLRSFADAIVEFWGQIGELNMAGLPRRPRTGSA